MHNSLGQPDSECLPVGRKEQPIKDMFSQNAWHIKRDVHFIRAKHSGCLRTCRFWAHCDILEMCKDSHCSKFIAVRRRLTGSFMRCQRSFFKSIHRYQRSLTEKALRVFIILLQLLFMICVAHKAHSRRSFKFEFKPEVQVTVSKFLKDENTGQATITVEHAT